MDEQRIRLTFTGGVWAAFGYTLLCAVLTILCIPAAWGVVPLLVWWCASLTFSDGSQAVFEGRPGRIWPLFTVLIFLSLLPNLATINMPHGQREETLQLLLAVVLLPFEAALKLPIYRWLFENIRLVPGGTLRFTGRYLPYLGWTVLFPLSMLTVVGWPFVATAMARWFCRNLVSDAYQVRFVGSGWGLLWRTIAWFVGVVVIVPIPWVLRSMYRWFGEQIEITRYETAPSSLPA